MTSKLSVLDRFEAKYDIDSNTGCWMWNAYVSPSESKVKGVT